MSRGTTRRDFEQLGPLRLLGRIGEGATARVYRAEDADGNPRAVKVRHRGDPNLDRRFLREFETMRLLRLPGVVPVYDAGIDGEWLWFSMDIIEGVPFDASFADCTDLHARIGRAVALGGQLLGILAGLHEQGFSHRDLKPPNVLVDASGALHVLDFGISRYFDDLEALSSNREVLGTLPYMAPEQVAGLPTDIRADLFSAGLMLWEAIAGPRPRPLSPMAWGLRICLERLPPLAARHREVPLALSALIDDLLAVEPRDRPSATEAFDRLRRIGAGEAGVEWPEPPWVDLGKTLDLLDGALGDRTRPAFCVIEGPAGAGKRRLAEQLQRQALVEGIWTLHLNCHQDQAGGPLLELLERLADHLDEATFTAIVGDAVDIIGQVWPQLPLARRTEGSTPSGSAGRVTDAAAGILRRLSERRTALVVVHDLAFVDPVTARALLAIQAAVGPRLGVVALHEPRWASPASRQLVAQLQAAGASLVELPLLSADDAATLATGLCPELPSTFTDPSRPQAAVEVGLHALASWRGEPLPEVEPALWPLAIRDAPVPTRVWRALVGDGARNDGWITATDAGVRLAGRTARALARARLSALRRGATLLAQTWIEQLGDAARPTDLAPLWQLALAPERAAPAAARAAADADRAGRWNDARRWLLLLDTLVHRLPEGSTKRFDLAWLAAHLALRSDPRGGRAGLLHTVEALATSPAEVARVRLLQAIAQLRAGQGPLALVTALRVATTADIPADLTVRALVVAVQARIVAGQRADALRELDRAEALLATAPDAFLATQCAHLRADLALVSHDLATARAESQRALQVAADSEDVRGAAFAAARLGEVLRQLGRRREAEHHARAAREAVAATGDAQLDAESGLSLATLLVERGDAPGARRLLDASLFRVAALGANHLLARAWRVALQIAWVRGALDEATEAMAGAQAAGSTDPEWPAALVRWHRARGDHAPALAVPPPPMNSWGHAAWRIERARARLEAGTLPEVAREAREALDSAVAGGYAELELFAALLLGAAGALPAEQIAGVHRRAESSLSTDLAFAALEIEARRLQARGRAAEARARWQTLEARAREIGHRPTAELAAGWLAD